MTPRLVTLCAVLACALVGCSRGERPGVGGATSGAVPGQASTDPASTAQAGAADGPGRTGAEEPVSLDGRWVVGARDRFNLVIEVDGGRAVVRNLDGGVEWEGAFVAEPSDAGYLILSGGDPALEVHAFVRSADELDGLLFGENGLVSARRVYPWSEDLQGEWQVGFSDNYHLAGGVARFSEESWRVTVGTRDVRSGSAYALGDRAGAAQVALRTSSRHMELANFVATPGETWLGWFQGSDQHMVLHRADAPPPWIPERDLRVPAPWLEGSGARPESDPTAGHGH